MRVERLTRRNSFRAAFELSSITQTLSEWNTWRTNPGKHLLDQKHISRTDWKAEINGALVPWLLFIIDKDGLPPKPFSVSVSPIWVKSSRAGMERWSARGWNIFPISSMTIILSPNIQIFCSVLSQVLEARVAGSLDRAPQELEQVMMESHTKWVGDSEDRKASEVTHQGSGVYFNQASTQYWGRVF